MANLANLTVDELWEIDSANLALHETSAIDSIPQPIDSIQRTMIGCVRYKIRTN